VGRKRLVPKPGYGQSLYDCIKAQRRADGTLWEAEDLAERLTEQGAEITGKTLRDWIKHGNERLAVAVAIAQLFGTTVDDMWNGNCKPINLPLDGSTTPRLNGGSSAADQRQSEAQGKRQLSARRGKQAKPRHRGTGS
jgi:DNA-binding XRE family transcriptional regulator